MLSIGILIVINVECPFFYCYAGCHYAKCRYANCRGASLTYVTHPTHSFLPSGSHLTAQI
jgi:hypothetical protein